MTGEDVYEALRAPFEGYYTAEGVFGPFLSGEQVTARLNAVLGVGQWMFHVERYDINPEADEVVALGELRAYIDGQWVTRQQFGGQKIKRAKNTGAPSNLADDHKGAATDAMKKCASLLGVGLYLMVSRATWHAGLPQAVETATTARSVRPAASRSNGRSARSAHQVDAPALAQGEAVAPTRVSPVYKCAECEQPLKEITIPARDGKPAVKWTVAKLRYRSLRRHGMVLCSDCWRKADALARTGQVAS